MNGSTDASAVAEPYVPRNSRRYKQVLDKTAPQQRTYPVRAQGLGRVLSPPQRRVRRQQAAQENDQVEQARGRNSARREQKTFCNRRGNAAVAVRAAEGMR